MLLGDVWAVIATIVGIAVCAWALLLCVCFVFVRRTAAAQDVIMEAPIKLILVGLAAAVVLGGGGILMIAAPFPLLKLAGWLLTLWVLAVGFTGTAGLVKIVGERIHALDQRLSPYGAMSRGAMFLILASIFPVLGWLLCAPIIFCLGVGAGLRVMRLKEEAPSVMTTM